MESTSQNNTMMVNRHGRQPERAPYRPALAPLQTQQVAGEPSTDRKADETTTTISDLNTSTMFEGGTSEFELMHVKITVLGLSGILRTRSNKKKKKDRMLMNGMDVKSPSSYTSSMMPSKKDFSAKMNRSSSTISSLSMQNDGATPTTAVISFKRNVTSSALSITSHLPSLPLGLPTSMVGTKSRYVASWPAGTAPNASAVDADLAEHSTFTLSRVMMKEQYLPERSGTLMSGYVHETIDLTINLSRGREIIPLGVASLVISGDEEGTLYMNLPAKAVRVVGKKQFIYNRREEEEKKRAMTPRMFKTRPKKIRFKSDPQSYYTLDENASLKVSVQVFPNSVPKETAASKARKEVDRYLVEEDGSSREQVQAMKEARKRARMKSYMDNSLTEPTTPQPVESEGSRLTATDSQEESSGFFCGSLCSFSQPSGAEYPTPSFQQDLEESTMQNSTVDEYLKENLTRMSMDSSVLSSVSGSESESDSDDETEDGRLVHINRRIVVRKSSVR
eukprot:CAMPEP_0194032762 /NCGR_PEP_ID=MMETSP0009_2-20130614/5628_1 /TAXON_ID=210454 /ORGANISM="Grammatophora oceanica, Strain CCMP 410" /LENGTH=505 /DNA_ID=CAMNT_0038673293 /DNA_START=48 /DNA_END=1565 /DNA_ORIENTATION=+